MAKDTEATVDTTTTDRAKRAVGWGQDGTPTLAGLPQNPKGNWGSAKGAGIPAPVQESLPEQELRGAWTVGQIWWPTPEKNIARRANQSKEKINP